MEPTRLLVKTALPLLMYSCIQIAFQFFDVLTVANISQSMVSTVLLVNDLQMVFNMVFVSISIAIGIRISQAFGAGNMEGIHHDISTIFFLTIILVSAVLCVIIPASRTILRLCAFPEDLIPSGSIYFTINMISLFFASINQIYFATVKARGNTRLVSKCNMATLCIKVTLNALIMYLVNHALVELSLVVYLLPAASCIAQAVVSVVSFHGFLSPKSMFRVHWRDVTFTRSFFGEFAKLSFPLMIERILTSSAKVICNGLYAVFGSPSLAAFACSGRIVSLVTTPLSSFEDAETTISAANIGGRQYKRVENVFRKAILIVSIVSTALFILVWLASNLLIDFFSKGDLGLAEKISRIYTIQRWDFIFVAIDSVCCGFLYAMKKTKLPTIINFAKLFAVRIPLFLVMTRIYGMDIEAIAWSILFSNMFDAVMSIIFLIHGRKVFVRTVEQETNANIRLSNAVRSLSHLDATDWQAEMGISVPLDLLLEIRKMMGGTLNEQEMKEIYQYALVEARIDELEKMERVE